jgi:hypothetical protein
MVLIETRFPEKGEDAKAWITGKYKRRAVAGARQVSV